MSKNTTPSLPVWIQDVSLEDIGRRGGHSLHVYCHGYWGDVITLRVRREVDFAAYRAVGRTAGAVEELPAKWEITLSHSSGGRDTGEIADDVEAEAVFAQGILAAVQHARLIRSQTEQLEKFYLDQARIRAEREAAEKAAADAAKAERVAKDEALGEDGAATLVAHVRASTNRRVSNTIYAYLMGEDEAESISARAGRDGVVRFFVGGSVVSAQALAMKLRNYSKRTHALAA